MYPRGTTPCNAGRRKLPNDQNVVSNGSSHSARGRRSQNALRLKSFLRDTSSRRRWKTLHDEQSHHMPRKRQSTKRRQPGSTPIRKHMRVGCLASQFTSRSATHKKHCCHLFVLQHMFSSPKGASCTVVVLRKNKLIHQKKTFHIIVVLRKT